MRSPILLKMLKSSPKTVQFSSDSNKDIWDSGISMGVNIDMRKGANIYEYFIGPVCYIYQPALKVLKNIKFQGKKRFLIFHEKFVKTDIFFMHQHLRGLPLISLIIYSPCGFVCVRPI